MLPDIKSGIIFICTGEPSGDEFAGLIINAHFKKNPSRTIIGVGGQAMKNAGARLIMRHEKMMVFGLQNFFSSFFRSIDIYRRIGRMIYRQTPEMFIGIGYPGINLLLCRYARRLSCKTYLFMPPQIWAWGDFRKYFIRKWVDYSITVFPFEFRYYLRKHLNAEYIVHPLINILKKIARSDQKKRIGFMPGSRQSQLKRHLPVIDKLIHVMRGRHSEYEFCIILHPDTGLDIPTVADRILNENRYQAMKNCDLIITTSGTASLEAAFLGVPQIFFHIPSFVDMHFFRHFVRIKEYNLANLYFGEKIVPKIISRNQEKIINKVLGFFGDGA